MDAVYLVLPHQLFEQPPIPEGITTVLLLEEPLFFTQFSFHRAKLVYHRATMRFYAEHLRARGYQVRYLEARELEESETVENTLSELLEPSEPTIYAVDPTDDWVRRKLQRAGENLRARMIFLNSPGFILSGAERRHYADGKKRLQMADFYRMVRRSRGILMQGDSPVGGQYSYDTENRKRLPKGEPTPETPRFPDSSFVKEAKKYVDRRFPDAPGEWHSLAPGTYAEAREALNRFLTERVERFGDYQDAVQPEEVVLFHSLLSPAINAGLLTPEEVVETTLAHAEQHEVPLNSLEGFLRQLVGWREFMLIAYEKLGPRMRSRNFFGFERPMPKAFYTGETGLKPTDEVIRRVLRYGYAHHIERLMFLGNPMLLCEIDPDEVYRWFMELFIDAYDWVMVPNVYGMSQFADGGLITTKPYVSSSNYIRKMSPYGKGNWATVWDALFWRFVEKRRGLFESNPRMKMMARHLERMGEEKLSGHLNVAEGYLKALHQEGNPAAFVASLS
jgi:deoxyribodipyrimidine photolyase-related protein